MFSNTTVSSVPFTVSDSSVSSYSRQLYSGGDTDGYLTDSDVEITTAIAFVISMFSLVGSIFIIICYIAFKHLRKFAFTLVMILSVTDVLNQAMDFLQPSAAELDTMEATNIVTTECYVQAIGNSIFELASVLWTTAIAATLYMFIFLRMTPDAVESKFRYMFLFCYGIPVILGLLPLSNNAYGPSGAWCWIRTNKGFEYWQFIQFYGPLWIAIIFNTFVYVRTWRLLRRIYETNSGNDETYQRLKGVMQRLQMYPFILLIVWVFASINRLYEAFSDGKQIFALYLLQRAFSSSQGLLNAIAYGVSNGVREAIKESAAKLCPRLFRDPSLQAAGIESMGGLGIGSSNNGNGGGNNPLTPFTGSDKNGTPGGISSVGQKINSVTSRTNLPTDLDDDVDDSDIRVQVPPSAVLLQSVITDSGISSVSSNGGVTNSINNGTSNIVRNPVNMLNTPPPNNRQDRVRNMYGPNS